MTRYALTDAQWRRLKPLLPPERPRTGRPNHDHRTILNGILWVLRTGAPWRDLPERFGPVGTVSSRFCRWREAGLNLLSSMLGDPLKTKTIITGRLSYKRRQRLRWVAPGGLPTTR